jgi:hypothetical protein
VGAGVRCIHHANTVLTACQFLRAKSLLSRGTAARRGLKQTQQYTDELDKRYGIWFDVFVDSVDIHARASTENHYGPVLFVLDVDLIKKAYTGRVWVTKLNPTKWKGNPEHSRWFQSREDLKDNFAYGTFDHMIVFRHCGGELPFGSYLREIILDDPHLVTNPGEVDLYGIAYGALRFAMTEAGLVVPIQRRQCADRCRCKDNYLQHPQKAYERFVPEI